jgi:chemotaxis protein MotB
MKRSHIVASVLTLTLIIFSGCASTQKTDYSAQCSSLLQECMSENERLQAELSNLERVRDALARDKGELAQKAESDLARAKAELEQKLRAELASGDMSLSMEDRGLVVTVLNKVLFDSGKAELKAGSRVSLEKVADVLKQKTGRHMIYIEGHTDTDPIVRSGWPSNWELSSARALAVVHYLVDEKGLNPKRIAGSAYGEFQSVASNQSTQGKSQNRRVEIVISPRKLVS